jgi:hypothetical protein
MQGWVRAIKPLNDSRRGISGIEVVLLLALAAVCTFLMLPKTIRSVKGHYLEQSRRLERPFDPGDYSLEDRSSDTDTYVHSKADYGVPRAGIFKPDAEHTLIGGMSMSIKDVASGQAYGEAVTSTYFYMESSGNSVSKYDYQDDL